MFRHDKIMHKSYLLSQLNGFAAILTSLPFFYMRKKHTHNRERESLRQVCYKFDMALCAEHRRHIIVKGTISASKWRIQYSCKNIISIRKRTNQRTKPNGQFALYVFTDIHIGFIGMVFRSIVYLIFYLFYTHSVNHRGKQSNRILFQIICSFLLLFLEILPQKLTKNTNTSSSGTQNKFKF